MQGVPTDRQRRIGLAACRDAHDEEERAGRNEVPQKDPGSVGHSDTLLIPGDWLLPPTRLRAEAERPVSNHCGGGNQENATQEMERQPTS
ncbi:hypothetical protein ARSEF4850_002726 [Beauveria asiatica]